MKHVLDLDGDWFAMPPRGWTREEVEAVGEVWSPAVGDVIANTRTARPIDPELWEMYELAEGQFGSEYLWEKHGHTIWWSAGAASTVAAGPQPTDPADAPPNER